MALGQEAREITVASDGHIWVASLTDSLTYPESVDDALDATFIDLGYATEDGVTFTATPTVEDINSWQSATPTRRITTARTTTLAFSLQQWNQDTFEVAFGGGTWTHSGGVNRYDPPADNAALAEFAVVIDAQDGEKNMRWVVMRATIEEAVETQLVRTGAAVLPVTFSALAPEGEDTSWYFMDDDVSFDSGSS